LTGINQPDYIQINDTLRLRKALAIDYKIAVPWYQDWDVYHYSEGKTGDGDIPDEDYVKRMYDYLDKHGENYFIEAFVGNSYIPIGDVTLKPQNPCIAIGVSEYREKGIGRAVMAAVLTRAKEIGIERLHDTMIYEDNLRSRRMFESLGFKRVRQEGNELYYELELKNE
ncbi:MAG: GNAT family N-acetyltransferase, partial [Clostridiales bacterium]|nr:GNAT family N-acetyltransferase [Clostridiales bacterium]